MENGITEYEYYEKLERSLYGRRSIEGKTVGCSRCVGYCRYAGHPGFLTKEIRREHDCTVKKCLYYLPKEKSGGNTGAGTVLQVRYGDSCISVTNTMHRNITVKER